jgi:anthranilate synthase component 1
LLTLWQNVPSISGSAMTDLLLRPHHEDFLELARTHDLVPVVHELTSDTVTAFGVYATLSRWGRNPFLLESVEGGERAARYSFVGLDPSRILEIRGGRAFVDGVPRDGDPLEVLRRETAPGRVAPVEDLPPFIGGALGHVGYDAVRLVERIPDSARDETGLPEAWFGLYDGVVALDRARQRLVLVALARVGDDPDAAWQDAVTRIEGLRGAVVAGGRGPRPHAIPAPPDDAWAGWQATPSDDEYLEHVARAREHILAGDVFQVVLSRRWRRLPRCSAAEAYRMLRLTNPSPYMFLLDTGQARVFGSSPEMLVRLSGGTVSTCPIAGTRPRAKDPARDQALERELLADPKERAEHVMLVDLGRNDVGRVARSLDPVQVIGPRDGGGALLPRDAPGQRGVNGRSAQIGLDGAWDAATAPASRRAPCPVRPRFRAMEIIDDLEPVRRGLVRRRGGLRGLWPAPRTSGHRHPDRLHRARRGDARPAPARASWL